MPVPEGGDDVTVDNCLDRVKAIDDDVFATYLYTTSKRAMFERFRPNAVSDDQLIDQAHKTHQLSFATSMERELAAVIRVDMAKDMCHLFLTLKCADFFKTHQRILDLLKTCTKMEFVNGTSMRFHSNNTQIAQCTVSPQNVSLYNAIYYIHHFDEGIDNDVPSLKNANQLCQHFEKTRTPDFFKRHGARYKRELINMLEWIHGGASSAKQSHDETPPRD